MATVLFVLFAAAFALLLFSGLQDQLPDELAFLRMNETAQRTAAPAGGAAPSVAGAENWQMTAAEGTVELSRRLPGDIVVNGVYYDRPYVGVLCHEGKLDMRIDTRMATTGRTHTLVAVDGKEAQWPKGTGTNVFPPDAVQSLKQWVRATAPVELTFSYVELGLQPSTIPAGELRAAVNALPAPCREQVQ